ncbi:MAG: peptidylprolyl isomerase [Planctomycetota bacterium]|jgi:cyclophilin family peptidyl-prolyl cis-trans isomerase
MYRKLWFSVLLTAAALMAGCGNRTEENLEDMDMGPKKVKLETSMGNIVIELEEEAAPGTVKNFLRYVEENFYDGTIFHRVIPNFMIQGGGFTVDMKDKETHPPIVNEFKLSNLRGTVAMAKLPGNPNSATSQFFINLANNSRNLDNQNGGFTVFGKVVEGMDVVDKIAAVKRTTKMGTTIKGRKVPLPDVPTEPVVIRSAEVVSTK